MSFGIVVMHLNHYCDQIGHIRVEVNDEQYRNFSPYPTLYTDTIRKAKLLLKSSSISHPAICMSFYTLYNDLLYHLMEWYTEIYEVLIQKVKLIAEILDKRGSKKSRPLNFVFR